MHGRDQCYAIAFTYELPIPPITGKAVAKTSIYSVLFDLGVIDEEGHFHRKPNFEGGWRRCKKCSVMFYEGLPRRRLNSSKVVWKKNRGICTLDMGAHEGEGEYYSIPYNVPEEPNKSQAGWRCCRRCLAMYCSLPPLNKYWQYDGNICPKDGKSHQSTPGNTDYVLRVQAAW
jgi:hypothetical protein